MAVPEASVDEHNLPPAGEHKVRLARQLRVMQPVSEPQGMEPFPEEQLRFGVLGLDLRHVGTALHRVHKVCHGPILGTLLDLEETKCQW